MPDREDREYLLPQTPSGHTIFTAQTSKGSEASPGPSAAQPQKSFTSSRPGRPQRLCGETTTGHPPDHQETTVRPPGRSRKTTTAARLDHHGTPARPPGHRRQTTRKIQEDHNRSA
eukprot:13310352-Alexandrium_andersonii.AAC.1